MKNKIINNSTPQELIEFYTNLIINNAEKTIGKGTNINKPKVP
jgi:hypothetical protein